ncbi:MAG: SCP2 sterol-binding domain-containing protein [Archangiaceae bacterium]|nr:SCP2 sterol-binding domain-containing protein [Archangiaceae bacterium]
MDPALKARLRARLTPELAKSIGRAYELRLVGQDERVYLDLTGAADPMPAAAPAGKVCSVGFVEDDLQALLDGTTQLKTLFMATRFRVFGDVGDAMKLEALFKGT